jgi:hypothetical protein
VKLRRTAARGGPVVAGLAALTLVTMWGQPAAGAAADPAQARAGTSAVDTHPYTRAKTQAVDLVKVTRPQDAPAKPGPYRPRHLLPELEPEGRDGNARLAPRLAPQVQSTRLARQSPSTLLADFDGVDAIDNSSASGFDLEPPDEGLGAGHGYVANFVNVTGAIYNMHGGRVQGPFYLNTFFGEPDAANTSDPRVYFDSDTRRWFATMLVYGLNSTNTAITESHIDIATSDSNDPTGSWHVYRVDASSLSHAGCPCLGDYPILGVDTKNIYISTQEFTSDESSYNGAQLYILPKSELVAGNTSVHLATFDNLEAGGSLGYRVQFANTLERGPAEFAMSTLDPNGSGDNRLVVWAVTHRGAVARGEMPSLSTRVISSEGYFQQPVGKTPAGYCEPCGEPTSGYVDSGGDVMFETQYIDGALVGAFGTGVNVAGDDRPRDGIGWVQVAPHISHSMVSGATHVARQGYVATRGLDLRYPHLNRTRNGGMALAFSLAGPQTYLSAATAVAPPRREFGKVRVIEAGVTSDDGFSGTNKYGCGGDPDCTPVARWGDYSNGQLIGNTNRIWLATQYIPNEGDGYANWGNRIWGLRLR